MVGCPWSLSTENLMNSTGKFHCLTNSTPTLFVNVRLHHNRHCHVLDNLFNGRICARLDAQMQKKNCSPKLLLRRELCDALNLPRDPETCVVHVQTRKTNPSNGLDVPPYRSWLKKVCRHPTIPPTSTIFHCLRTILFTFCDQTDPTTNNENTHIIRSMNACGRARVSARGGEERKLVCMHVVVVCGGVAVVCNGWHCPKKRKYGPRLKATKRRQRPTISPTSPRNKSNSRIRRNQHHDGNRELEPATGDLGKTSTHARPFERT